MYKYNCLQGNADVLIDICNIFSPYRVKRLFSPYLLVGVGANGRFNNDEASAVKDRLNEGYYWEGSKMALTGRAGVGLAIRLCDLIDLNIEVNSGILTDKFNSKKGSKVDFQSNALVGLKFNFGKWALGPEETAKLDALAAILMEHPESSVSVTGYADVETGSARRNMYLSQKRAEGVASYLESRGVSRERIVIAYKGSTERPYDTPARNRVAR